MRNISFIPRHHRLLISITEVQAIVNPITSKLYADGAGPQSDDEEFDGGRSHDEL